MNILITGSSGGIGCAASVKFLDDGNNVFGLDKKEPVIKNSNYIHYISDICEESTLPNLANIDCVINAAGTQNSISNKDDIDNNLKGLILCTKKYILNNCNIKSVVNIASASAHNGSEFGEYCASKGGVLSYTKWTAKKIAKYGAVCNSLSFGGVITDLNKPVIEDKKCWDNIMAQTPLKKWMSAKECADWIYFFAKHNKSCTAQDLIIDNGEFFNHKFIWPENQ